MADFQRLLLRRWRQFKSVDLNLDGRLVDLTGPNGRGKTTILGLLGRHFGWTARFLSSPLTSKRENRRYSDAWDAEEVADARGVEIGTLTYTNNHLAKLLSPETDTTQSNLQINAQIPVSGVHIPSHRPPPSYSRLQTIPVDPKTTEQHFQAYQNFLFQSYGETPRRNPSVAMKESLHHSDTA